MGDDTPQSGLRWCCFRSDLVTLLTKSVRACRRKGSPSFPDRFRDGGVGGKIGRRHVTSTDSGPSVMGDDTHRYGR